MKCQRVDYLYGPSPIKAIRASGSLSITLLNHVFQMSIIGYIGGKYEKHHKKMDHQIETTTMTVIEKFKSNDQT